MARKKKEQTLEFNLENQLLEDFRQALSDVTSSDVPQLKLETSLVHHLSVNSLAYLETVQIVSDKYGIFVSTEELQGSIFVGRAVLVCKEKILQKFSNNLSEIEAVAKTELNLAKEPARQPALLKSFMVQTEQGSKKRR